MCAAAHCAKEEHTLHYSCHLSQEDCFCGPPSHFMHLFLKTVFLYGAPDFGESFFHPGDPLFCTAPAQALFRDSGTKSVMCLRQQEREKENAK